MDSKVAARYAKALFSAADKVGAIGDVEQELDVLADLGNQEGPFRSFLRDPQFGRDRKIELLDTTIGDKLHPLTIAALRLMVVKGRAAELDGVRRAFVELRRERDRLVFAHVASAQPLDEQARKELIANLEKRIQKKIEPEFVVEPSLIGGVRVTYLNTVLDGSVRGSFSRLRRTLEYDVLKQI